MTVGSKTLLYGVHAFWLHPLVVAAAWIKLYGFPWDPRLWLAFLVHDWGYWGKKRLDDEQGETHPILGARIMSLFGPEWREFVLTHSRSMATRLGRPTSRLCNADKLAIGILPWFVYVPLARLTGEIREYKSDPKHMSDAKWYDTGISWKSDIEWYRNLQKVMKARYG